MLCASNYKLVFEFEFEFDVIHGCVVLCCFFTPGYDYDVLYGTCMMYVSPCVAASLTATVQYYLVVDS